MHVLAAIEPLCDYVWVSCSRTYKGPKNQNDFIVFFYNRQVSIWLPCDINQYGSRFKTSCSSQSPPDSDAMRPKRCYAMMLCSIYADIMHIVLLSDEFLALFTLLGLALRNVCGYWEFFDIKNHPNSQISVSSGKLKATFLIYGERKSERIARLSLRSWSWKLIFAFAKCFFWQFQTNLQAQRIASDSLQLPKTR